jgi:integrase
MPTENLTAKSIATLRAIGAQTDYFDGAAHVPGFGLRVSRAGRRTWFLMYRGSGRRVRRLPLGTYPPMLLADARTAARVALLQVQTGVDPAAHKQAHRTAVRFEDLAERFITVYAKPNKKTWYADLRQLRCSAIPVWRHRSAIDLTRGDVTALLDDVHAARGGVTANRLLSVLSKLFSWAVERQYVPTSPVVGVRRTFAETSRERFLSDDEVLRFWQRVEEVEKAGDIKPGVALWLRLRLLTAQRGEAVHPMKWADVDLAAKLWDIPAADMKGGVGHLVPLTPYVCTLLTARRVAHPGDVYVMQDERSRRLRTGVPALFESVLSDFQLRDLRRTATTGMARLKVPRFIQSRVLGHVDSSMTGIYDRFEYLDEKRAALLKWEGHVLTVIRRKGLTLKRA